jgi:hypothetical protein
MAMCLLLQTFEPFSLQHSLFVAPLATDNLAGYRAIFPHHSQDMAFSDSDDGASVSDFPDGDRELGILKAGRQALGLTRNYVPDWQTRDGFRELYQNW